MNFNFSLKKIDDEHYKVDNHIKQLDEYEVVYDDLFQEIASNFTSTELKPDKPLWEALLIQNYKKEENAEFSSVVLMKYNHSIADGFSSVLLLLNLCTTKSGSDEPKLNQPRKRENKKRGTIELLNEFFNSSKNLVLPKKESQTLFSIQNAEKKKTQTSTCRNIVNVTDVKKIAKKYDCTVNDIIYSCFTGAIRKYIIHHSTDQERKKFENEETELKAAMWISLRKPSWFNRKPQVIEILDLNIGVSLIKIPIKEPDPKTRLQKIHQIINTMILSFEPIISHVFWVLIGLIPSQTLIFYITKLLGSSSTFSFSNVPGPNYQLQFVDSNVESMTFFTNPKYTMGVFFCFISYNNWISASSNSSSSLGFKSEEYYKYLKEELESLK
jgi:diacylglycerol O-acyltransferase / wax synthase